MYKPTEVNRYEQRGFTESTEPTEAERREANRQYDAVVSKYKGTALWMKAPNGEPSKLTERQWVQVRTENFKKWFGDWEKIALQKELDEMKALAVTPSEEVLTKRDIESLFEQAGAVKNSRDGRIVTFPKATAGKVFYHKGSSAQFIAPSIKEIFEQSIPIYSEPEKEMPGHKSHRNIKAYHNYVNKISLDGNEYYVRFTVREEAVQRNNKEPKNETHSFAISAVELYQRNKGSSPEILTGIIDPGEIAQNPIDKRLNEWFESVNENEVSKVVDENGEPLVVYHGTTRDFDTNGIQLFLFI